MKLLITEEQYKRIFLLSEQYIMNPEDYQSGPSFELSGAPEWFDQSSAQWLVGPTGGGMWMDKYGSKYGQYISERKKPLSDDEKAQLKVDQEKLKNTNYEFNTEVEPLDIYNKDYNTAVRSSTDMSMPGGVNAPIDLSTMNVKHTPNPYGDECNPKHIKNCENQGLVARTVEVSGKELNKAYGKKSVGDGGWWDFKTYAQCKCVSRNNQAVISQYTGPDKGTPYYDYLQTQGEKGYYRNTREMVNLNQSKLDLSSEVVHIALDVLAIIAYASGVGLPIALGLEALNSALYFAEGDNVSGSIAAVFAFIPGGTLVRRSIRNKYVLKQIDHVVDNAIKYQKGGQTITRNAMEKELKEKLGEKVFNQNAGKINAYFKIAEEGGVNATKKRIARYNKWVTQTQDQYKAFIKDETLVRQFLDRNGGDLERAYAAYLKSLPSSIKKQIKGVAAYFVLLEGINKLVTMDVVQENMANAIQYINSIETTYIPGDWTLADDASKGNISSIVRLAGYNWPLTRDLFMVTPYSENPQQNYDDNVLLKKAWRANWRPTATPTTDPQPEDIILVPEEYWTKLYKERLSLNKVEPSYDIDNETLVIDATDEQEKTVNALEDLFKKWEKEEEERLRKETGKKK